MRQLGTLRDPSHVRRFVDYLLVQGIDVQERSSSQGDGVTLWVVRDEQLESARTEFAQFQANPDAPQYQSAAQSAKARRKEQQRQQRAYEQNFRNANDLWAAPHWRTVPITTLLLVICILLEIGKFLQIDYSFLYFNEYIYPDWVDNQFLRHCEQILQGQVWRLFTPILLHGGIIHLLFNMSALFQLGPHLERLLGRLSYAVLILGTAAISNTAQCYMTGPAFLGMSGVLFGLFGFLWIRAQYDSSIIMTRNNIYFMLGWLFLCLFGIFEPAGIRVANTAHVVGLLCGMAYAVILKPFYLRRQRSYQ